MFKKKIPHISRKSRFPQRFVEIIPVCERNLQNVSTAITASYMMNPPGNKTHYKRPSGPRTRLNTLKPLNIVTVMYKIYPELTGAQLNF